MKYTTRWKWTAVMLADLLAVLIGYWAAYLLRFDFRLQRAWLDLVIATLPHIICAYLGAFHFFSLYRGVYHYSSFADLLNITKAVATGAMVGAVVILFVLQGRFPRSVLVLHPILTFLGVCGVRFAIRSARSSANRRRLARGGSRRVLLLGAGDLGEMLLRQILNTPDSGYRMMGFIDDDPGKRGRLIHGFPVLGNCSDLRWILKEHAVDEIIISIASRRGEILRSVIDVLKELQPRPELRIAPSLSEMLRAPGEGISVRRVNPADLLNRDVVRLDQAAIARLLIGRTILVSGAGGTIGSELCRQILEYGPGKLVMVENHATSLFYRERELREKGRATVIVPVLGDIRDAGLVERIFKEHRPEIVLHAAAHKHVHQLEYNVQEGVSNNILGTYYLGAAADRFGAECFVQISTDKAVRPRSVMGATKRVAELVVQHLSRSSKTRFICVRFGNVLGSSGSVLRIFEEQIAKGGPISVTDPMATRYFMTVGEAVGLILQSVVLAKGGEICVLRMGMPVRIMDLAKNLILLSGLEPGKDIEIHVTGLRQGEKLDEELLEDRVEAELSDHPEIMVLRSQVGPSAAFQGKLLDLELASRGSDSHSLVRNLMDLIPTFDPAHSQLEQVSDQAGA